MADTIDMRIPLGQVDAIKEAHKVKQQSLELNRPGAARRRKQKKKKPPEEFAGCRGSKDQRRDSKQMSGEDKESKARGSLLDVII